MIVPRTPIFVIDGLDVIAFETVEKAEQFLEPIDVENDDYSAYDSEGRLLRFGVKLPDQWWRRMLCPVEQTFLKEIENEPTHADELREKLLAFLLALGTSRQELLLDLGTSEQELRSASLPELVSKTLKVLQADRSYF